jgi:hypothetical protein
MQRGLAVPGGEPSADAIARPPSGARDCAAALAHRAEKARLRLVTDVDAFIPFVLTTSIEAASV